MTVENCVENVDNYLVNNYLLTLCNFLKPPAGPGWQGRKALENQDFIKRSNREASGGRKENDFKQSLDYTNSYLAQSQGILLTYRGFCAKLISA